ncbi:MAG: hypothetical protein KAS04_04785 [Candidatus Aenigmarchaeota archaeon]|nr:hypothetical protein [Candidatus Aenigmarchaeota archaeon]
MSTFFQFYENDVKNLLDRIDDVVSISKTYSRGYKKYLKDDISAEKLVIRPEMKKAKNKLKEIHEKIKYRLDRYQGSLESIGSEAYPFAKGSIGTLKQFGHMEETEKSIRYMLGKEPKYEEHLMLHRFTNMISFLGSKGKMPEERKILKERIIKAFSSLTEIENKEAYKHILKYDGKTSKYSESAFEEIEDIAREMEDVLNS